VTVEGQWFSLSTPVPSTNKTDHHNIAEILLKLELNTMNQNKPTTDIFTTEIYNSYTM
jgi:hypothetical protein